MPDLKMIARYPFLRAAADYIRNEQIELEQLLTDALYLPARELGCKRALSAVSAPTKPFELSYNDEIGLLYTLLSYPVARMIISATRDRAAIARYAVAESKNLSALASGEKPENIVEIANDFGIEVQISEKTGRYAIHFTGYLTFTSQFRGSPEWKLAYQDLENGWVHLSKEKFLRILEEALKRKIERELPLPVDASIRSRFQNEISQIREIVEKHKRAFPSREIGALDENAFPPCMKKILEVIRAGENAPHMARFAIVAFLKGLGLDAEQILKLFSTSPDFDPAKSRYQVEHITGKSSHTEYKSPGCATMKSYGLCMAGDDALCGKEWMKHPWVYYRYRKKELKKQKLPSPTTA
ncbi:MAG: DNA primase large subunit PriL [Thermoplasmata archaeon]|nr:DNA primase large subunit PriL [Thermoplasmata archaeon]